MKAAYERGVALSKRFVTWFRDVPEPVYDPSVRAPRDHSPTIIVFVIGVIMIALIVGQALQRAEVFS